MKKVSLFIIVLLVLPIILSLILQLITIKAQEVPGLPSELQPENVEETAKKAGEVIQQTATKWDYLSKEWKKILLENKVISSMFNVLNKASKILIGRGLTLSFGYIFLVFIFTIIIIISYKLLKETLNMNFLMAIISSLIISSLSSRYIPQEFLEFQMSSIMKIIVIIILIVIIMFIILFSEQIKKALKKEKEEKRELKAKAIEKIHDLELESVGVKKGYDGAKTTVEMGGKGWGMKRTKFEGGMNVDKK